MSGDCSEASKCVADTTMATSHKRQRRSHALEWLLGDSIAVDQFLTEHLGKKVFSGCRDPNASKGASELFGIQTLYQLCKDQHLVYGVDMNVVSCPDGKRKKIEHEKGKLATADEVEAFLGSSDYGGKTIQFFQPQRFVDVLHGPISQLEAEFSTLWGANVYLTAAGTQGLAPHYDDVEVFVVQTEGSKRWKVHGPTEPFQELALESSADLEEVGPLLLDVTLKPGDILYLPRGTTHYALATGSEPSVHITLSTHSGKDTFFGLLDKGFSRLLDAAASSDKNFRQALPVGYLKRNGTWRADRATQPSDVCTSIAQLLRKLADELESSSVDEDGSVAQALHESIDEYSIDFMTNRLPPCKVPMQRELRDLNTNSSVRFVDLDTINIIAEPEVEDAAEEEFEHEADSALENEGKDVKDEGSPGDIDDDNANEVGSESASESDEPSLVLLHTMKNDRESHMGPEHPLREAQQVRLPGDAMELLSGLRASFPAFVPVSELSSDERAIQWVSQLYEANVLEIET
mmetsp:Transcript_14583/g.26151  ORF Transcript_14583/g.26151 Transcript_14583/m.26151 type:complete len:519 (+) Transcript_14583:93-1649(+)